MGMWESGDVGHFYRKRAEYMFREYCFGEENSLSLTEFCGKLGEFCEKLCEFALAHKSLRSVFETVLSETVFGPFPILPLPNSNSSGFWIGIFAKLTDKGLCVSTETSDLLAKPPVRMTH